MAGSPCTRQASSSGTVKPALARAATGCNRIPHGRQQDTMAPDGVEQTNDEEIRKYRRGKKLGEGTYAIVYLGHARDKPSELVAIKKIKVQKEFRNGLAPDAVRELKHLQELRHPNIIMLHSVFNSRDQNLNLVLEFLPRGDLEGLIRDVQGVRYGAADIKAWMGMLTRAVAFCHANFVLHRDIKPNNLLIAADGEVKLADFGLARSFADPVPKMTANVITRWYRPPELLFGARHYAGAVDVWSVGLVFAELVIRNPWLPGKSEIEQIQLICRHIGTPTEDNWPGVTKLPGYTVPAEATPVWDRDAYRQRFGAVGADGADLLMRTLMLDPRRRLSAREMLEHRWWRSEPRPSRKEDLPMADNKGDDRKATDLKRCPDMLHDASAAEANRCAKVARKLDFGAAS